MRIAPSMTPWLYYTLATLLIVSGGFCWLANLFGLPGNWVLLGLVALFAYFVPYAGQDEVSVATLAALFGLAIIGEVIEFAAGAMGAANRGASRKSVWLSLVGGFAGSIVGAVVGLPIPLIGSVAAALAGGAIGAFGGAYIGEIWSRQTHASSVSVAKGAFIGRVWGTVGKFAIGGVMLGVATVDLLIY